MNAFVKNFDNNYKYMYHLFNDKEVLEKYNAVWDKVNNQFKKESDSESVYDDKYIKAKINLCNVNFYHNKAHREKMNVILAYL